MVKFDQVLLETVIGRRSLRIGKRNNDIRGDETLEFGGIRRGVVNIRHEVSSNLEKLFAAHIR